MPLLVFMVVLGGEKQKETGYFRPWRTLGARSVVVSALLLLVVVVAPTMMMMMLKMR